MLKKTVCRGVANKGLFTCSFFSGMFTYLKDSRCHWFTSWKCDNYSEFQLVGTVSFHFKPIVPLNVGQQSQTYSSQTWNTHAHTRANAHSILAWELDELEHTTGLSCEETTLWSQIFWCVSITINVSCPFIEEVYLSKYLLSIYISVKTYRIRYSAYY